MTEGKRRFLVGDVIVKEKCSYTVVDFIKGTYKVQCSVCNKDKELFNEDHLFTMTPTTYQKHNSYCCGCSKSYKYYTTSQIEVLCERAAKRQGAVYKGGVDKDLRFNSRVRLEWVQDGVCTYNVSVNQLTSGTVTNPVKSLQKKRNDLRKDDQELINFLLGLKCFPENTLFSRDEAMNKPNRWLIECPVCKKDEYSTLGGCDYKFRSHMSNLRQGKIPCRCSLSHKYTEQERLYDISKFLGDEYQSTKVEFVGGFNGDKSTVKLCKNESEINLSLYSILHYLRLKNTAMRSRPMWLYLTVWKDSKGEVFHKYGITQTTNLKKRISKQRGKSKDCTFIECSLLFWFPTYEQAYFSELVIKTILSDCKTMLKKDFPDGYTETVKGEDEDFLSKLIFRACMYTRDFKTTLLDNRSAKLFQTLMRLKTEIREDFKG